MNKKILLKFIVITMNLYQIIGALLKRVDRLRQIIGYKSNMLVGISFRKGSLRFWAICLLFSEYLQYKIGIVSP